MDRAIGNSEYRALRERWNEAYSVPIPRFAVHKRESVESRYAGTIAMGEPAAFFPPEGRHSHSRHTSRAQFIVPPYNILESRSSTTVINAQVKSAEIGMRCIAIVNAAGLRP